MTTPEVVIFIALGTLLIQPVTSENLWETFAASATLILALVITEVIQFKKDGWETIISGKAVTVIEKGQIQQKNLKRLRLTVDKLETRLRQSGIASISDVDYATIEVSGQIGYTLKKEKQPATKEDIQNLIVLIQSGKLTHSQTSSTQQENIFTEVTNEEKDSTVPKYLQ